MEIKSEWVQPSQSLTNYRYHHRSSAETPVKSITLFGYIRNSFHSSIRYLVLFIHMLKNIEVNITWITLSLRMCPASETTCQVLPLQEEWEFVPPQCKQPLEQYASAKEKIYKREKTRISNLSIQNVYKCIIPNYSTRTPVPLCILPSTTVKKAQNLSETTKYDRNKVLK